MAIHSTDASTSAAAGAASRSAILARARFGTRSVSIFGETMGAAERTPRHRPQSGPCRRMCAHTSVSSFITRHTALFANPTFRPTVLRPAARCRLTSAASGLVRRVQIEARVTGRGRRDLCATRVGVGNRLCQRVRIHRVICSWRARAAAP